VVCCVWLLSLSIVFSKFVHVAVGVITFYCQIIVHCLDISYLSIHQCPLMSIWIVSTFWLLWIMLLWLFMYKFLCGHFKSLGYTPRSGISGLCNNSMFNFWGTVRLFQSGCTVVSSLKWLSSMRLVLTMTGTIL